MVNEIVSIRLCEPDLSCDDDRKICPNTENDLEGRKQCIVLRCHSIDGVADFDASKILVTAKTIDKEDANKGLCDAKNIVDCDFIEFDTIYNDVFVEIEIKNAVNSLTKVFFEIYYQKSLVAQSWKERNEKYIFANQFVGFYIIDKCASL